MSDIDNADRLYHQNQLKAEEHALKDYALSELLHSIKEEEAVKPLTKEEEDEMDKAADRKKRMTVATSHGVAYGYEIFEDVKHEDDKIFKRLENESQIQQVSHELFIKRMVKYMCGLNHAGGEILYNFVEEGTILQHRAAGLMCEMLTEMIEKGKQNYSLFHHVFSAIIWRSLPIFYEPVEQYETIYWKLLFGEMTGAELQKLLDNYKNMIAPSKQLMKRLAMNFFEYYIYTTVDPINRRVFFNKITHAAVVHSLHNIMEKSQIAARFKHSINRDFIINVCEFANTLYHNQGKIIEIVGLIGAGKSTILNVFLKFDDVWSPEKYAIFKDSDIDESCVKYIGDFYREWSNQEDWSTKSPLCLDEVSLQGKSDGERTFIANYMKCFAAAKSDNPELTIITDRGIFDCFFFSLSRIRMMYERQQLGESFFAKDMPYMCFKCVCKFTEEQYLYVSQLYKKRKFVLFYLSTSPYNAQFNIEKRAREIEFPNGKISFMVLEANRHLHNVYNKIFQKDTTKNTTSLNYNVREFENGLYWDYGENYPTANRFKIIARNKTCFVDYDEQSMKPYSVCKMNCFYGDDHSKIGLVFRICHSCKKRFHGHGQDEKTYLDLMNTSGFEYY